MKRNYEVSSDLPEEEKTKVLKEVKLGYINLSDGMFEQAKLNFMLALQYDEKCADAYWGLMLVKYQLKNEDDLFSNPMLYKDAISLPECDNALANASENQRKIYKSLLEKIYIVNEGDNY